MDVCGYGHWKRSSAQWARTAPCDTARAMSQENVEVVRAAFEAWNRNDFDAWIQYFDPEVQWSALTEEFRGHAGIRQAWQFFKVDFQLNPRYDEIRDLGGSVLTLGELTGTGRITGLNLSNEIAQPATFRTAGFLAAATSQATPKPSKPWAYRSKTLTPTPDSALETVGLTEQAMPDGAAQMGAAGFEPATSRV